MVDASPIHLIHYRTLSVGQSDVQQCLAETASLPKQWMEEATEMLNKSNVQNEALLKQIAEAKAILADKPTSRLNGILDNIKKLLD